jgi:hypothetical protein
MFLMGLPIMLLAMGAGWFLFPALFGPSWREAGVYVAALAPMALAQFTAACADSSLLVLERQDLAFVREVVRTGLLLGAILAAHLLRWNPRPAIFLFGATGTLAYVVYGLITWHAIRSHAAAGPGPARDGPGPSRDSVGPSRDSVGQEPALPDHPQEARP